MPALAPGFADPVTSSQMVFRAVMHALARPGTLHLLAPELTPPPSLGRGMAAVALALVDYESPVWLDASLAAVPEVAQWLRFHTGAPLTTHRSEAAFALVIDAGALPSLDSFALGTAEYPDRSTTLVIEVARFEGCRSFALAGPGIAGVQSFSAGPLPEGFGGALRTNRTLFPRGVDLVFVCGDRIAALPRSTRVVEGG